MRWGHGLFTIYATIFMLIELCWMIWWKFWAHLRGIVFVCKRWEYKQENLSFEFSYLSAGQPRWFEEKDVEVCIARYQRKFLTCTLFWPAMHSKCRELHCESIGSHVFSILAETTFAAVLAAPKDCSALLGSFFCCCALLVLYSHPRRLAAPNVRPVLGLRVERSLEAPRAWFATRVVGISNEQLNFTACTVSPKYLIVMHTCTTWQRCCFSLYICTAVKLSNWNTSGCRYKLDFGF